MIIILLLIFPNAARNFCCFRKAYESEFLRGFHVLRTERENSTKKRMMRWAISIDNKQTENCFPKSRKRRKKERTEGIIIEAAFRETWPELKAKLSLADFSQRKSIFLPSHTCNFSFVSLSVRRRGSPEISDRRHMSTVDYSWAFQFWRCRCPTYWCHSASRPKWPHAASPHRTPASGRSWTNSCALVDA